MNSKIIFFRAAVLIVVLIITIFMVDYFANPYKKIQAQYSEDGYYYLNFYKKVYTKKSFDSLLARLIIQNTDALSINVVASFIEENNMCWMSRHLNEKCALFDRYPRDTTWLTKLDFRTRESSKEMLYFSNGLYSVRDRLNSKCK